MTTKAGRLYQKHEFFAPKPVKPGDELEFNGRRWPVIAVSTVPGLDGAENHREVAV